MPGFAITLNALDVVVFGVALDPPTGVRISTGLPFVCVVCIIIESGEPVDRFCGALWIWMRNIFITFLCMNM